MGIDRLDDGHATGQLLFVLVSTQGAALGILQIQGAFLLRLQLLHFTLQGVETGSVVGGHLGLVGQGTHFCHQGSAAFAQIVQFHGFIAMKS